MSVPNDLLVRCATLITVDADRRVLDDAWITVIGDRIAAVGSGAPDRGFDMVRHRMQVMHYHRRHCRDATVLPEGKVLEMCTIDAARAMGLDQEIGAIEVGKKADIVLLDGHRPHLWPPVNRITHFANASDVTTVIVNGRLLLDD